MILLEYEAKELIAKSHIATPKSTLYSSTLDVDVPCVLKSQVPTGGRGKLGGIRVVRNAAEAQTVAEELLSLDINGHTPTKLLAEELLSIQREYYLSISVNRSLGCIELAASREGGVDVESTSIELFRQRITPTDSEVIGEALAEYLQLESHAFALQQLVKQLYSCFINNDCLLIEINPLVLTDDNKLVAADCKLTLDDAAQYRHPKWSEYGSDKTQTNFVTLNPTGTVATIANGAGLAMATVDAVTAAGLVPANFLDIGGGATVDGIVQSFETITRYPNISAIIINIFGGIVRCDDVARGIVAATEQFPDLPPLYIRLSGTNLSEARDILRQQHITLYPTLAACLHEVSHA